MEINQIMGISIVILNLIPFIIRKPKYLFLTAIISLIIIFLLLIE